MSEFAESAQFLTFRLDKEIFALDILKVREVLDFKALTEIPQTPDFLKGVINLRGSVVSVIDMRSKFGMPSAETDKDTSVIIMSLMIDGEETLLGALVDGVEAVIELKPEQITPPPNIGTRLKLEFIRGMGIRDDRFLIILDLDRVFSIEELNLVLESQQFSPEQPVT